MKLKLTLLSLLIATSANAAFIGPEDVKFKSLPEAIEKAQDDDFISFEGYIVERKGAEAYIFKAGDATIMAFIDTCLFPQKDITPETKVIIKGKMHKKGKRTAVKVKELQTAN